MSASTVRRCAAVATFLLSAQPASPQNEQTAAAFQSQAVVMRRVFTEVASASQQRQLFNLSVADLLLTPGQGPLGSAGLEEAVAADGLVVLTQLEKRDGEIGKLASSLVRRIREELDFSGIPAARPVILRPGEATPIRDYTAWMQLSVEPDMEYRVTSSDCPVIRAVAMASDRTAARGGATSFERLFSFVSSRSEVVFVRIRTPFCERGTVAVSAVRPSLTLSSAPARVQAFPIEVGRTYRGTIAGDSEQWVKLPVERGMRYTLETRPFGRLDTSLTAYNGDGATSIAFDDDGGGGLGSKIDLVTEQSITATVRIRGIASTGSYELSVSARPHVIPAVAGTLAAEMTQTGTIAARQEQWWRLTTESGQRYIVETQPSGSLDTRITAYRADAATMLGSDDDSGSGFGSRLDFAAPDSVVLLKVEGVDGSTGAYDLRFRSPDALRRTARELAFNQPETSELRRGQEQWWRVAVAAGARYVFEAIPKDKLDPAITIYQQDGVTALDSDDDGGGGLSSRLVHRADTTSLLFLKVEGLGGTEGAYDVLVSVQRPDLQGARLVTVDSGMQAQIGRGEEQWWRLPAMAGTHYEIEATPAAEDDLDTILSVYTADGTRRIATDDDSGERLGSKLEIRNTEDRTLLIQVFGLDETTGRYTLTVKAKKQ